MIREARGIADRDHGDPRDGAGRQYRVRDYPALEVRDGDGYQHGAEHQPERELPGIVVAEHEVA